MKEILRFLNDLQQNNQREWFAENKAIYQELNQQFNKFITHLLEGIVSFDESLKNVSPQACLYKIYRDVRFSPNKLPYKTHFAAYMCPGGKKSGYAGYYFHIESENENYIGANILAAGCHCPEPIALKSIREDIEFYGAEYRESLNMAKEFTMSDNLALAKVPKGFDKNSEFADLLKLKDFSVMRPLSNEELCGSNLLEFTIEQYKKVKPFNDLLNRAIAYAQAEYSNDR